MKCKNLSVKPISKRTPISSKGLWVDLKTHRQYPVRTGNAVYFDSQLEYSAYLRLLSVCPFEVARQWPIELVPTPNLEIWKADFYIPECKTIVEVKGDWLENKANKAEKHLFRLTINICLSKGYKVILLGKDDSRIQKLSIPVIGIKELTHVRFTQS